MQDARPLVVLTTYEARVFTTVAQLKRLISEGAVRYAFLNTYCGAYSTTNAACSEPARWIREHGTDVSIQAGRPNITSSSIYSPARSHEHAWRRWIGRHVSAMMNTSMDELAADARAASRFAFDTEFMGEGRYRTLLCLIQLAVPDADPAGPERIELIHPLEQDLDGAPLAAILADLAIQTVVHAGRQDVALVRRRFATDVHNVFDTHIAAGFAGLGAQSSYDTLLAGYLDVRLAKSASFTRWDTRPLSPSSRSTRARTSSTCSRSRPSSNAG